VDVAEKVLKDRGQMSRSLLDQLPYNGICIHSVLWRRGSLDQIPSVCRCFQWHCRVCHNKMNVYPELQVEVNSAWPSLRGFVQQCSSSVVHDLTTCAGGCGHADQHPVVHLW